jgi:hypothetical protein
MAAVLDKVIDDICSIQQQARKGGSDGNDERTDRGGDSAYSITHDQIDASAVLGRDRAV